MKRHTIMLIAALLLVGSISCNLSAPQEPAAPPPTAANNNQPPPEATENTATQPPPPPPPSGDLIQPADLVYQGAFRLPDAPDDEHSWEWCNWASALTSYPAGDDTPDGYPGSLFGTGHDLAQLVSEISIPIPVVSPGKNVDDLNTASTLQPFADVRGGMFPEMEMPRVGLAYLPPHGAQTGPKLYFAWAPHLDEDATNPSHGWCELDLSNPQPAGAWRIADYDNYVTGDYLFDIPQDWADAYVSGRALAIRAGIAGLRRFYGRSTGSRRPLRKCGNAGRAGCTRLRAPG
jgi:hypothetical protein